MADPGQKGRALFRFAGIAVPCERGRHHERPRLREIDVWPAHAPQAPRGRRPNRRRRRQTERVKTRHWLVKSEPDSYSWESFVRDDRTDWTGVRNFQARNNLRAMKTRDPVLFYASGGPKAVIGMAEVTKDAFADPTADEPGWLAVELKAVRTIGRPVTLSQIKADPGLAGILLLRNSRLSVIPLTGAEFARILDLGKGQ
jgi:predicted RNA-binding protein with PUA-like domain